MSESVSITSVVVDCRGPLNFDPKEVGVLVKAEETAQAIITDTAIRIDPVNRSSFAKVERLITCPALGEGITDRRCRLLINNKAKVGSSNYNPKPCVHLI